MIPMAQGEGGTRYQWYRPGAFLTEQTGSIPDTANGGQRE